MMGGQQNRSIDTGGGAYVNGDVQLDGGNFVGRDKHEHYHLGTLATTTPFQTPQLRDQYVERTAELKRLKGSLLSAEKGAPLPTSRALLHGIAAVGKSTLAAAFAHDRAVRAVFPDGVLWVTLGTDPDIPQRLADWGRALGDLAVLRGPYADEKAGTAELRSRLQDKACLLVVDDAWEPEHVEPFLVGGPLCLLLVTSRRADMLTGATEIPLDEMLEVEALQLMANWTGDIDDADQTTAAWLAKEVGYLPLALELLAAQAKAPAGSWPKARLRWEARKLGVVKRGRRPTKKEDSLQISLELSLAGLDQDDQESYLQLGVFPEDSPFPVSAAAALWGRDAFDSEELLIHLAGQALLTPRVVDGKQRYTFHDVQRDFVVECLGEARRVEAHAALVDGYRARCGGAWAELEPDGYLHDHLAWHMAEAGLHEELKALIDKPWMEAQFERTSSHRAFARDVGLAIAAASAEKPVNWVTLVRGCLLYATLGSMATNVPPEALGVLALTGDRRQVAKARGYADLMQSKGIQADAYRLIGEALWQQGELDEAREVLVQALAAAEGIGDEWPRALALSEVAQALAKAGEVAELRKALAAAEGIEHEPSRARALNGVAQALAMVGEEGLVKQTLAAAKGVKREDYKAEALSGIAQALAGVGEKEALWEALAAAEKIENGQYKARALKGVAQALAQVGEVEALRQALLAAEKVEAPWHKALAVSGVVQALAQVGEEETTATAAQEALAAAKVIEEEWYKARALSAAAQALAKVGEKEGMWEAWNVAKGKWEYNGYKARALSGVAQALAQAGEEEAAAEAAQQALDAARIGDELSRVAALSEVAQAQAQVGEAEAAAEALREAWDVAEGVVDEQFKAEALREVAQALAQVGDEEAAAKAAHQALAAAAAMSDERHKAETLSETVWALAKVGKKEALREALAAAKGFVDERYKADALSGVAQALAQAGEKEALREALAAANKITDEGHKARALLEMAQALAEVGDEEAATEALAVTEGLWVEWKKAGALAGVAQALAKAGQGDAAVETAQQALAVIEGIRSEWARGPALSRVAQALAAVRKEEVLQQLLGDAAGFVDEQYKAEALSGVAQALAKVRNKEGLWEAWKAAKGKWGNAGCKARALCGVAQALAQVGEGEAAAKAAQQALAVAANSGGEWNKAETLSEMAQVLAKVGKKEALLETWKAAKGKWEWEHHRARAVSGVAQGLAAAGEKEDAAKAAWVALEAARGPWSGGDKANALSVAAQALAAAGEQEEAAKVARQALEAAEGMGDQRDKAEALGGVAQTLAVMGQVETLRLVQAVAEGMEDEGAKARALSKVSQAWIQIEQPDQARTALLAACKAARLAGRDSVFEVVEEGAPILAGLKEGRILLGVYEAIQEVDGWWGGS